MSTQELKLSWIPAEATTVDEAVYYLAHYPEHGSDGSKPPASSGGSLPKNDQVIDLERPPPPLFALLIGICEYEDPDLWDLSAPVTDATAMKTFLMEYLRVPEKNIQTLFDKQATRVGIENAIRQLGNNDAIKEGDPILIFYAGHGSQAKSPPGWPAGTDDGLIQMLDPHDFVYAGSDNPDHGQGVLDIVLSKLLAEVSRKKGNNITVIFDSCHSTSGTRDGFEDDIARGVKLPDNYSIPLSILDKYEQTRGTEVSSGFGSSGLSSHVLLAGCMQDEQSWERQYPKPPRGRFSLALLELLQKPGMLETLTYRDLIQCLPALDKMDRQHPQCEGFNQSRVLFNSRVPSPRRQVYPVKYDGEQFVLEAGEAHGITFGAQFAVYADNKLSDKLGSLQAISTKAMTSSLRVLPDTPTFSLKSGFALLSRPGKLEDIAVLIPLDNRLLPVWVRVVKEMQQPSDVSKRGIRLVGSRDQAELELSLNKKGLIEFGIVDPRAETLGLSRMPFEEEIDPDRIWRIISSAADFCYHLRRSNKNGTLSKQVKLECHKLEPNGEFDDEFRELLMPQGENVNDGGLINVSVGSEIRYGYKLSSSHDIPLYASVFYFDISDLSITSYYQPGSARDNRVEPTIRPKGHLTIGYGSGGGVPWSYTLRQNQKFDVGFLKVFLTTDYVDFSNVEQRSPFERSRDGGEDKTRKEPTWDTITATIVQRPLDFKYEPETPSRPETPRIC